MTSKDEPSAGSVIGGVDTHKDLHVAAVVDHRDRVLGTRSFPSTRQGYRQMLAWMRSFGEVRFMQQARPTRTIAADAARTTTSMPRVRRMRLSLARAPSRPAAGMG